MGYVLSKPTRWAHVHNNTEIMHACYSSSSAAAVGARLKNMCALIKKGSHVPAQAPYDFFLGFPEMLQGGHLLSWYHEILHASPLLSSSGSSILLVLY